MEECKPNQSTKVLDIGVTGVTPDQEFEVNYFERLYPWPENLTGATLDDPEQLKIKFPKSTFIRADGVQLPFGDKSFDVVFSSAVVEHVGSRARQRRFIEEACRVGHMVCITTPNRYFPIEAHSHLPLVSWLPLPAFYWLMKRMGWEELASEEHLNPLSARSFLNLFGVHVTTKLVRFTIGPFTQNLIVIGRERV